MTVRDALLLAKGSLEQRDAELLLCHALGRERTWLLAHPEAAVDGAHLDEFRAFVSRRAQREPLQYIVGGQEFYGLSLRVSPAVLIPRPETELLVEAVLDWAKDQPGKPRIVDVGTGSGALALALVANLPDAEIFAVDLSVEALVVAEGNAARLGLGRRVRFLQGDLLRAGGMPDAVDAVVSNPPYVPAGDAATMQRDVVDYEPHGALFAGEDGVDVYRRLIPQAGEKLRPGGLLAMEIGHNQGRALAELLKNWEHVRFIQDYAGISRIVLAECTES